MSFICTWSEKFTHSANISRTNVASVGSVFNDTRKIKVLSLPETIKKKSTFRAKALRRAFASGSERTSFGEANFIATSNLI